MRTMPSDAFQISALARLVSYFGWTWVGVIGVESDYAHFAIQHFLQELVQYGVCPAYIHFYPVVLSQQALDELLDVIQVPLGHYRLSLTDLQQKIVRINMIIGSLLEWNSKNI